MNKLMIVVVKTLSLLLQAVTYRNLNEMVVVKAFPVRIYNSFSTSI